MAKTLSILHPFATADGTQNNTIIQSGGKLYGGSDTGGANGDGAIWSYDLTSGAFTVLHSFDGTDGSNVEGNLLVKNGTLYGTAVLGGSSSDGTLFSLNLTTNAVTVLHNFSGADGINPHALVMQKGTFYGVTEVGGPNNCMSPYSSNCGTVFSYKR